MLLWCTQDVHLTHIHGYHGRLWRTCSSPRSFIKWDKSGAPATGSWPACEPAKPRPILVSHVLGPRSGSSWDVQAVLAQPDVGECRSAYADTVKMLPEAGSTPPWSGQPERSGSSVRARPPRAPRIFGMIPLPGGRTTVRLGASRGWSARACRPSPGTRAKPEPRRANRASGTRAGITCIRVDLASIPLCLRSPVRRLPSSLYPSLLSPGNAPPSFSLATQILASRRLPHRAGTVWPT